MPAGRFRRRRRKFNRRFKRRNRFKRAYSSFMPATKGRVAKLVSGGRAAVTSTRIPGFPTNRIADYRYFLRGALLPSDGTPDEPDYTAFDMTNIKYPLVNPNQSGLPASGFGEWARFYDTYVVIGCNFKITYTYQGSALDPSCPLICFYTLEDQYPLGLTGTDVDDYIRNRKCKWSTLQPAINGNQVILTGRYDAKRWHSLADIADADSLTHKYTEDYRHFLTSRLPDTCYLVVGVSCSDGTFVGGDGDTLTRIQVEINYTALASDEKILPSFPNSPYDPPPE